MSDSATPWAATCQAALSRILADKDTGVRCCVLLRGSSQIRAEDCLLLWQVGSSTTGPPRGSPQSVQQPRFPQTACAAGPLPCLRGLLDFEEGVDTLSGGGPGPLPARDGFLRMLTTHLFLAGMIRFEVSFLHHPRPGSEERSCLGVPLAPIWSSALPRTTLHSGSTVRGLRE